MSLFQVLIIVVIVLLAVGLFLPSVGALIAAAVLAVVLLLTRGRL